MFHYKYRAHTDDVHIQPSLDADASTLSMDPRTLLSLAFSLDSSSPQPSESSSDAWRVFRSENLISVTLIALKLTRISSADCYP